MKIKPVVIGGVAGGILLSVLLFGLNIVMNLVIPYDITAFGGMRPMDDPVMMLFFLYPFVLSFAAALIFGFVHPGLAGSGTAKGISFGILLIILVAIPSNFAMFASMNWPVGFYIGNIIWAVTGFPLMGILFSKVWKV